MARTGSLLTGLACRACGSTVTVDRPIGTCPSCGQPLFAVYDLEKGRGSGLPDRLRVLPETLWGYGELLPVQDPAHIATLGEGGTPVLKIEGADGAADLDLWLKDDGIMPTGSFKARGMAVAVSRAQELGLRSLFVPSAGNAGLALAAYGARTGLPVRVYLPASTSHELQRVCRVYGAEVVTVPGTIREAGETARAREKALGGFDMSTLREPYRLEGKKTMGLELFSQFASTRMPDAIVYPTGGGTGLVGMHKAFDELRQLGLLETEPRLIAVQPEGCAPVVRAVREGTPAARPWEHPHTIAPGLLVPSPFASERILEAIRRSHGSGLTVPDSGLPDAMERLARLHGVSTSPEGAAVYAALPGLIRDGLVRSGERILLYNTGSGAGWSVEALRASLRVASSPRG
jgi:threonine synthase